MRPFVSSNFLLPLKVVSAMLTRTVCEASLRVRSTLFLLRRHFPGSPILKSPNSLDCVSVRADVQSSSASWLHGNGTPHFESLKC